MSLFITVGSTYFDQLIQETASSAFLNSLASLGIKKVVFQYGASEHIFNENIQAYNKGPVMDIEGYKYKSSIQKDIEQADIIISHAGAGTILQTLRLKNKKMIVVINDTLMDNHQYQLAQAMESRNYLVISKTSELLNTLKNINKITLTPFPAANPKIFASVVDEQMGFAPSKEIKH